MRPPPECVPVSCGEAEPVNRKLPGGAPASTARRTRSQTGRTFCHSSIRIGLGAASSRSRSAAAIDC